MARRLKQDRYHSWKRFFNWDYEGADMEDLKSPTWDKIAEQGLVNFQVCGDARGPDFLAKHPLDAAEAIARMAARAHVEVAAVC